MKGEAEKPTTGTVVDLDGGVRRILAPNPGAMTHWGTNTYLLGTDPVVVVDPGPDSAAHKSAILAAVGTAQVLGVAVTHAHLDHSALAPALARDFGAPVMGFGAPDAGRSDRMQRLSETVDLGGGEGVDHGFDPDMTLADGDVLSVGRARVTALHTPGHFAGHLSFCLNDVVLTGDVVMGWSTTLISPPDGDLRAFLQSAGRLRALGARRFLPGHGGPVDHPTGRLDWLIAHRFERARQVLGALDKGAARPAEVAGLVYRDLDPVLLPAATRNVLAHLLELWDHSHVRPGDGPLATALWSKR